ncbi:MAG: hypothetical protein Q8Q28_05450 [Pseudomonadota bacterium]|nr:hypothetical protein [Pseudomonadota bacterium]
MSAITFDTLKFTKALEKAGVPAAQAEAFAEAFKDASGEAEVATKRDIEKLEGKIAEMKFDLLKWVVGLALAQFGILIGILLKLAGG